MNTLDKFKDILVEQLGVDLSDIDESSSVIGDLGADSLDTVEIQIACEEEFIIDLPIEFADDLNTVADWVEALGREGA